MQAAASPLHEMMRYTQYDDPRYSCHEQNLADFFRKCQELSMLN